MRRSELVSLTWQQIEFANQTIRIYGKGKKERLLPLHPHLIPLLLAYQASLKPYQTYATEPVFLNKDGQALDPRGLNGSFRFNEILGVFYGPCKLTQNSYFPIQT